MNSNIGSGTAAYISLDNARANYLNIRNAVPKSAGVMCVIKANAYGHGAQTLAPLYEKLGASAFGVATASEAVKIRETGTKLSILILGYTPVSAIDTLIKYDISQCVFSEEYAMALSSAAAALGKEVKVHIKMDTGMSRIGFCANTDEDICKMHRACMLPGLVPVGVFTHLSSSDEGERQFTLNQLKIFDLASRALQERLGKKLIRHALNSAGIINYPEFSFDMVRAGIILYGMYPSKNLSDKIELLPLMTLRSEVSLVKDIEAGTPVGYSRKFVAKEHMRIATVQIGYADGFFRCGSLGNASLTVLGKTAKTVGNVCMDQLMLDVGGIPGVKMGDGVIIFGEGGISAEELSEKLGTICYELTSTVGERVPRIYVENGKIVKTIN